MPRFSEQRQKEEIMNKVKQILSVLLCTALCVSSFAFTAQAKDTRKYVKSISLAKKATVTIPADKKNRS